MVTSTRPKDLAGSESQPQEPLPHAAAAGPAPRLPYAPPEIQPLGHWQVHTMSQSSGDLSLGLGLLRS